MCCHVDIRHEVTDEEQLFTILRTAISVFIPYFYGRDAFFVEEETWHEGQTEIITRYI